MQSPSPWTYTPTHIHCAFCLDSVWHCRCTSSGAQLILINYTPPVDLWQVLCVGIWPRHTRKGNNTHTHTHTHSSAFLGQVGCKLAFPAADAGIPFSPYDIITQGPHLLFLTAETSTTSQ